MCGEGKSTSVQNRFCAQDPCRSLLATGRKELRRPPPFLPLPYAPCPTARNAHRNARRRDVRDLDRGGLTDNESEQELEHGECNASAKAALPSRIQSPSTVEGESPAPSSPSFLRGWDFPSLLQFWEIMINYSPSSSSEWTRRTALRWECLFAALSSKGLGNSSYSSP